MGNWGGKDRQRKKEKGVGDREKERERGRRKKGGEGKRKEKRGWRRREKTGARQGRGRDGGEEGVGTKVSLAPVVNTATRVSVTTHVFQTLKEVSPSQPCHLKAMYDLAEVSLLTHSVWLELQP